MSGRRLLIGVIVMGVIVPIALAFFLQLERWSQILTASAITFLAWGVADLVADILTRPRLAGRSPHRALRELDMDERTEN